MTDKVFDKLEVIQTLVSSDEKQGRISRVESYRVRNLYRDGSFSKPYHLDVVSHIGLDAVGVLPYWLNDGEIFVRLLKSFRPAQMFRSVLPEDSPFLVEIIAGVLEDGEHNADGVKIRAVAELLEEAGVSSTVDQMRIMGEAFFSSPGVYTEQLHLTAIEIDPDISGSPTLDGSVMEELIETFDVSLKEARAMCLDGRIRDAKTEIALERFVRLIADKL